MCNQVCPTRQLQPHVLHPRQSFDSAETLQTNDSSLGVPDLGLRFVSELVSSSSRRKRRRTGGRRQPSLVSVLACIRLSCGCFLAPCRGASRGATCLSSRPAEAGYERERQTAEGVLFRQTQEHSVPVDCDDVQATSRCDNVAGVTDEAAGARPWQGMSQRRSFDLT